MNIRTIQKLLLTFTVLLFVACEQEEHPQMQGTASLQLRIKGVEKSSMTRGVEDLNNDGTVSDLEMYVDGQKIYRLGVYLLEGNNVVASTELEAEDTRFSNGNSEATISFDNLDYSKTYELYAVANYGNYNGITANVGNIDGNNLTSGLKVNASTSSNICPSNIVYPLTLKQQLKLNPGVNTVNGQLQRTYARLRINVRNLSGSRDITIASLSFPNNFIQSSADLFTNGGTANVAPTVTSTDAITPFQADMIVPKINASGNVSETTIFDAYLLESNNGSYEYTITLKVANIIEETYTVSEKAITNNQNIENGAMYVISNTSNNKLYANVNDEKVGVGSSYNNSDGKLNHNYVWRFNNTNNNNYTIESIGAEGYFMKSSAVNNSTVPLKTNPNDNDYFTVNKNNSNITLKSTSSTTSSWWNPSPYYIAINNNNSAVGDTNSYQFNLYKVTKENKTTNLTHEAKNIPIQIVDKNSGKTIPLTTIHRNDFIDILVNVTYNENTGDIEFEVSNWDEKNGEVTFD